jgi:DNA repair protein RadD
MHLRAYQENARVQVAAHWQRGGRSPLIQLATGGGKTALAAAITADHERMGGEVLFLAPRIELIRQTDKTMARFGAKAHATTIQQLAMSGARPRASLVVLDEARHYVASEWLKVVRHYIDAGARLLGLDGTPMREDEMGLGEVFDHIVIGASHAELLAGGWLVPSVTIGPDKFLGPNAVAQDPVQTWLEHGERRKTIAYCGSVEEAESLAAAFRAAGVRAKSVDGTTAVGVRSERLSDLRHGRIDVLTNCALYVEGLDETSVSCILITRAMGLCAYLQTVGRAIRAHEGKTSALILDLPGNIRKHGPPNQEIEWHLDGKAARVAKVDGVPLCPICKALVVDGVCPDCLREAEAKERERVRILNERIARVEMNAAKPMESKREAHAKLTAEAKARGYAAGWVKHRYKARFGEWPPWSWK